MSACNIRYVNNIERQTLRDQLGILSESLTHRKVMRLDCKIKLMGSLNEPILPRNKLLHFTRQTIKSREVIFQFHLAILCTDPKKTDKWAGVRKKLELHYSVSHPAILFCAQTDSYIHASLPYLSALTLCQAMFVSTGFSKVMK